MSELLSGDNVPLLPSVQKSLPGVDFFARRVAEIIADPQGSRPRLSPRGRQITPPSPRHITLLDVIRYGHTNWTEIQPRTDDSATELHRLAYLMANPVEYHERYPVQGPDADSIAVGEDWSIQNGRRRALVAACLDGIFVRTANMDKWITVVAEPS